MKTTFYKAPILWYIFWEVSIKHPKFCFMPGGGETKKRRKLNGELYANGYFILGG